MSEKANIKAISIGLLAFFGIGISAYFIDRAMKSSEQTTVTAVSASETPTETATGFDAQVSTSAGALQGVAPAEGASIVGRTDSANVPNLFSPSALTATPQSDSSVDIESASASVPGVTSDGIAITDLAPSIDTFFRNPDETTVIAGRATPGQTIAIMLGGEELDRVVTGADGTFGTVVFIAAADQPRRLRLIGDPDGQELISAESVIVPPSAPVAVAGVILSQPAPEIGAASDTDSTALIVDDESSRIAVGIATEGGNAPDVLSSQPTATATEDPEVPEASAPPTLIADAEGVRVIQPADGTVAQPELVDNIALDAITYDPTGEVILSGRAPTDGFVQIYLDNQPITTSRISEQGDWSIDLPDVDTGVYTLRVDEVANDGTVQSRIETPFKREERATVAAILAEETSDAGFDIAVKTVQPGNTLWAIAEERFGDGIMYVAVFEANKDLIRDPDLIYPGQVFRLPDAPE